MGPRWKKGVRKCKIYTKALITRVWIELQPKHFHQQLVPDEGKIGANLSYDLLITDPGPNCNWKNLNRTKSNCIFYIKNWNIEPWFWMIWIALLINFFLENIYFFWFQSFSKDKLGLSWIKNENFRYVLSF